MLIGSTLAQIPLLLAFMLAPSGILAGLLMAGIGFVTVMSFSVSVVMGQEYLPSRLGIASGVTLGLAIGIGGVAAAVLGVIADESGLGTVMWTIALLPLASLALALTLPMTSHDRSAPPQSRRISFVMQRTRTFTWSDPLVTAQAAHDLPGIDAIRAIAAGELPPPPIAELLDFEITLVEPGRVIFAIEPAEWMYNPIGSVHGGVAATLLDSSLGCAVHTVLDAGRATRRPTCTCGTSAP